MPRLGVNIDHVATVRQARRTFEPDPVAAAVLAELGGADSIVVHLREDRRHIQDRDLRILRQTVHSGLNLEMALCEDVIGVALDVRPDRVTFVPERRQEITTEGGLDVVAERDRVTQTVHRFKQAGIPVSLFIDPTRDQVETAQRTGAGMVELHTGGFANAPTPEERRMQLFRLGEAAILARNIRLEVAAGHGLTYFNIGELMKLREIAEFNIGHSIIARAVLVGLTQAVREMKALLGAPGAPGHDAPAGRGGHRI